jgi:hypothetical protein
MPARWDQHCSSSNLNSIYLSQPSVRYEGPIVIEPEKTKIRRYFCSYLALVGSQHRNRCVICPQRLIASRRIFLSQGLVLLVSIILAFFPQLLQVPSSDFDHTPCAVNIALFRQQIVLIFPIIRETSSPD